VLAVAELTGDGVVANDRTRNQVRVQGHEDRIESGTSASLHGTGTGRNC
jgi:hypothetical protein